MRKIKTGVIGLGCRGKSLICDVIMHLNNAQITAVCDLYEDRVNEMCEYIGKECGTKPLGTTNYREVLKSEEVEAVIISTAWEAHTEIALAAMENGKAVGVEVGGVYSVEQCWQLVNTYERLQVPFMFLENCCFGKREMMALNMSRMGVFGDIVYCKGGYHHDLRHEIAFGRENRHYRLENYIHRNCDNYPTHELGPIAKLLRINDGNRMVSLTSSASCAKGMHEYISEKKSDDERLMNTEFKQGDIIVTNIQCAGGELITLTLDTTLPRYYSRDFTVRGTKGMYEEATDSIFLDNGEDEKFDMKWKERRDNALEYEEKYMHPLWKKYIEDGVRGTHDGMDWLMLKSFFDCLINKEPMPVDVYDAAAWMCISTLSEFSVSCGGMPVEIPDFTNGKWIGNYKELKK